MNRRRLILTLAVIPAYWSVRWALRNKFVLTNESGQAVHDVTVEVCDRTFHFDQLLPGDSVSARFGTPSDESIFVIRGLYADGSALDDGTGYVVWEEYSRTFRLVILPDGMVTQRFS